MYFPGSAFLVSFTDPNSQLPNVKSVFKYLNDGFSMSEIYRFVAFLGIEVLLFIKQCPLKFMSGNKWWSAKVGATSLSDLVIFSIFSFYISLDFHELIGIVPLK